MANRGQLIQALRNFLKEASVPKTRHCRHCRLPMKHITATFEIDGEDWTVALPFCPRCSVDVPDKANPVA
jgi:hypothetical protein